MNDDVAVVTGAGGLVGSAVTRLLIDEGFIVVGVDNDMRSYFFGPEGTTEETLRNLERQSGFQAERADIRDESVMQRLIKDSKPSLVVHTAAQPSHDWAAGEPFTDFGVNAVGTLNVIEAVRSASPDTTFAHISTSKVYGDTPNRLPLVAEDKRLDLPRSDPYFTGIRTDMSIDQSLHSLFGVSKASGDLIVQEYGRYFQMPTVCFRPGCVTGADHAGVELHGFLAYLMKATATGRPYTVFGYEGKQVRCNVYAEDLAKACLEFHRNPKCGAVYNIGGGRKSACSMLEAIEECERIAGRPLNYVISPEARIGDHRWWISDIQDFMRDYPNWVPTPNVTDLLTEIYERNAERWRS